MRYLFALVFFFSLPSAWADMTLTIIDQDNVPVADAVVMLSSPLSKEPVSTSNSIAVMDQINESFVPRVLVVQKGQYVSFPNSDDIRHHVYSFSEPKTFEIKLYKGTDIDPVQFDKPGLVVLGCNIHDDMIGYIIVADHTLTLKTDKNGQVRLPAKQGDSVSLWSERIIDGVSGAVKQIDITNETEQTVKLELLPPIKSTGYSTYNEFGKNKW